MSPVEKAYQEYKQRTDRTKIIDGKLYYLIVLSEFFNLTGYENGYLLVVPSPDMPQDKSAVYQDENGNHFTINHIQGCAHGCKYPCYAMSMAKRFGKAKTYEEWCEPKLAENALEVLDKEIPKLKDKINSVHLCFTSDPFMYGYTEVVEMSIKIIKKLNLAGIKCTVLTKGVLPIELSELSPENEYGITLVSLDENFRKDMEPNTAPFNERIKALRALHNAGCKTWVSMEPYPTPNFIEQDLNALLNEVSFCDKIIFGRLNYNKKVSEYKEHKEFFNICAKQVVDFCKVNNKQYHIKNGTITK